MTEQMYTVKEISELMQVHPLTVIRWIKGGKLQGLKVGGGRSHWRIAKAELDRITGALPVCLWLVG